MADEKKVTTARREEPAPTPAPQRASAEDQRRRDENLERSFPSLHGDKELEVQKRNYDGDSGTEFEKHYTLLKRDYFGDNFNHDPNIKNTRELMLHAGLRPTGDVRFVEARDHDFDSESVVLVYSGPVIPAVIGGDAGKEPDVVLAQQIKKDDK